MLRIFLFLMLLSSWSLFSDDTDTNVLIYTDPVQISSEINEYENITSGVPIQGSVMVTHQANNPVDQKSFMLGNKPLKTTFVQTAAMSSASNLVVSIYIFQLDGMAKGMHNLDPIKVEVGGKVYEAPPLTVMVGH